MAALEAFRLLYNIVCPHEALDFEGSMERYLSDPVEPHLFQAETVQEFLTRDTSRRPVSSSGTPISFGPKMSLLWSRRRPRLPPLPMSGRACLTLDTDVALLAGRAALKGASRTIPEVGLII